VQSQGGETIDVNLDLKILTVAGCSLDDVARIAAIAVAGFEASHWASTKWRRLLAAVGHVELLGSLLPGL
jgi:hypothetical protein